MRQPRHPGCSYVAGTADRSGLPSCHVSAMMTVMHMLVVTMMTTELPHLVSGYHLEYTLALMRRVNESLIVPSRLVPPLAPDATASDPLVCRANRTRWHKPPPYNSTLSDHHFAGLPLMPPNVSYCPPLNFSSPMDGHWVLSDEGPQYLFQQRIAGVPGIQPPAGTNGTSSQAYATCPLPACRLRRLSADTALTCLRNKHIAFMGDSTTRYQAMSLMYYLSNDGRQDPVDSFPTFLPGHAPSIVNMGHWGTGWPDYYGNTTAVLTEPGCIHTTCAACVHDSGQEHWQANFTLASGAQTRVSMFTVLGHGEELVIERLRSVLNTSSPDRPDVFIFNQGIWFVMGSGGAHMQHGAFNFIAFYELMFQYARAFVDHQPPPRTRLVFRATTSVHPQSHTMEGMAHKRATFESWDSAFPLLAPMVKNLAATYGVEYYDIDVAARRSLAQGLERIDNCHWRSYMNDFFNDLLFNTLC